MGLESGFNGAGEKHHFKVYISFLKSTPLHQNLHSMAIFVYIRLFKFTQSKIFM